MALNITNITQINSFYDMGKYAADSSSQLFWAIILIVLFVIIIMRLRLGEFIDSVIAASFACFIISIIFLNLGFLQLLWPIFFGLALAGAIFVKKFRN